MLSLKGGLVCMRMKMRKSVLSTACVTVQQQTSSKQGGTSVFSILKCFLLSETMTEVSSTGSPQTTGRPTQCSPQSVLPYFLAVNTMRLDPPPSSDTKLPPWCQAFAQWHNPFTFSTTDLTLWENLSSSSKFVSLLFS